MGEIIIKVPLNTKKIYDFSEIEEVIELFKELEKIKNQDKAIDYILKNAGKLPEDFKVSEEELHLQGD